MTHKVTYVYTKTHSSDFLNENKVLNLTFGEGLLKSIPQEGNT